MSRNEQDTRAYHFCSSTALSLDNCPQVHVQLFLFYHHIRISGKFLHFIDAHINAGHEGIVAALHVLGGIHKASFRVAGHFGNQLEGRVELTCQPHDGLEELPEAARGGCLRLAIVGAQVTPQVDDVVANVNNALARLDDLGNILGYRSAARVNVLKIAYCCSHYLDYLLEGTVHTTHCRQHLHQNFLHGLNETIIIAIQLDLFEPGSIVGFRLRNNAVRETIIIHIQFYLPLFH